MSADDERALAAIALRRLAREMRALAAIEAQSPAALASEADQARRAVAETRREAVHALERLRDALPLDAPIPWMATVRQVRSIDAADADTIDGWAGAWET